MRTLSVAVLSLVLFSIVPAVPVAAKAPTNSIVLRADRVAFYSNKYIVTADGNVKVTFTDGTTFTGRSFEMDLKANRFVVAGDVAIVHGSNTYTGAAFGEFLDLKRGYFIPVSPEPDRWTFLDSDYANPVKGRQMPGDAFYMPETGGDHAFILAKQAFIVPKTGIELKPAWIYTFGAYTPTPSYYQNFSANPYFAQNGLAGAVGAVGYPFLGGSHGSTTLFGRYDSTNKEYLAIQQNLAWENAYTVFSISPLTRDVKQYNLLGLWKTENQRFQIYDFNQLNNFQSGFSEPLSSGAFSNLQLTYALHNSFLQLTGNQYWSDLMAPPTGDQTYGGHGFDPDHPNNFTISWNGSNTRVGKYIPINFKLRAGILTAHDAYGLPGFDGTPFTFTSYWQHFFGFTVWSLPYNLTPHAPFDQAVNLSMTYDRQRTIVDSLPRFQDAGTLTTMLSKLQGHKGSMYLSYSVSNDQDVLGPLQQTFYPPTTINNPYNGLYYPGYSAFIGLSTTRDLQYSYTYTPTAYFSATVTADKYDNFPQAIPYFNGSPYDMTLRVNARINPILSVLIQRTYYFNWGNQGWNQWTIQFGP